MSIDDVSATGDAESVPTAPSLRQEVLEREESLFGGIKLGSAFFGWLTASGTAILLTGVVAAVGTALGFRVTGEQPTSPEVLGILGASALFVILFIAYYCGGYVAGRMARFNGMKQGFAVWLWAIVVAVVIALVGALAGSDFLETVNTFTGIPIDQGDLTLAGVITAIVLAIACLAGAVIGGAAGMRFHRRVDEAGLGG